MGIASKIYERLPIAGQHAAATLQGALYYRTRYAGAFHPQLAWLRANEFSPAATLRELQDRELRRMLKLAFETVPYYRKLARDLPFDCSEIRTASDLKRLPLTSKDDVRRQPEAFLSDRHRGRKDLIPWNTSGTTGTPLTLRYAPEAVQKLHAFVELYREQAGVGRRVRRGQFTGKVLVPPSQSEQVKVFWRFDWANQALLLSTMHMRPENLPYYAEAIRRFRPQYLSGYPSSMYVLAQYYDESGRPAPRLRAALTSAETVLAQQRETIERVFGGRLYDQYGQTEMQSFWYECSAGGMHAHPLAGVTELLDEDGTPASEGDFGEVVLTGLVNEAMPLIRYRVGDRARAANQPCGCGRHMPVIAEIDGRLEDYVYTEERGLVGRLDPAFKGVCHIVESQIVQESLDLLRVHYVPAPEFALSDLSLLEENLRARVGRSIAIEFLRTDHIPRTANGKFRAVISKLPQHSGRIGARR